MRSAPFRPARAAAPHLGQPALLRQGLKVLSQGGRVQNAVGGQQRPHQVGPALEWGVVGLGESGAGISGKPSLLVFKA